MYTHRYISNEKGSGVEVIEGCFKRLRSLIYSLIGLFLCVNTLQS